MTFNEIKNCLIEKADSLNIELRTNIENTKNIIELEELVNKSNDNNVSRYFNLCHNKYSSEEPYDINNDV